LASGFGKVQHLRKRLTMIMSGTTPRLLGVWGTLGSLGLAVVLLPVNATWAQKPEEKQEIRIIVKTDDDATDSDDAVTAVVSAVPVVTAVPEVSTVPTVATEVVTTVEAGNKEQFNFAFKTDDSASVIAANSLDEAIKKLNHQIKEIAKKIDSIRQRQSAPEGNGKRPQGAQGSRRQDQGCRCDR
jgi:uncharacterized surface anchored protein